MKEPIQELVKEFWEWCGVEFFVSDGKFIGKTLSGGVFELLIDLNNLFKYAVPKAVGEIMLELGTDYDDALHSFIHDWMKFMRGKKDPVLALFWALFKVMKKQ